ncbi:hypothetical protein AZH53_01860 [Methanomicrobiaceae archaeon CYW5]|nr:hypothetical protein [Methanovulcanius yangii]
MRWEYKLAIFLVFASVSIYSIKFAVFHNPQDTVNYLFNSMGFLPINVLLVTVVLNSLLTIRSRREKLQKLNMVIGTFFSEIGNHLLVVLSDNDPKADDLRRALLIREDWDREQFSAICRIIEQREYEVNTENIDLVELHGYLMEKRDFMLRLLENPVLLEHQSFTELLSAVFHLNEELWRRDDFTCLPASDCRHLEGDIVRVYRELVREWIYYMQYLKDNYPYMFSLALRTNPFDEEASPVVA